ncbi:GNAT family acetyltransferase [Methylobacterium iners]|uniref:Acetyltransferase YpeA n=1 Tax=Methylobacterium iners TaxID=418707 RepID=A0ABQ4RWU8_9HYPH|nr:GNAT family acetyltransferase [Methylobacterium iners]GJD94169.1 Acetyltransferase YpeA [Methylobacterium iners]
MADAAEQLTIRAFTEADRGAVKDLWRACGLIVPHNDPDRDIDGAAGKPNSDILVGLAPDGRIAASVMVGHDGHRGWLYYVAVAPSRQGQGLGRDIVASGEAWLRAKGVPKAQLMIRETNLAVRDFYASLGWRPIPRLVMERWL